MVRALLVAYEPRDFYELASWASQAGVDPVYLAVHKAEGEAERAAVKLGVRVYAARTSSPELIAWAVREAVARESIQLVVGEAYRNMRDALSRVAAGEWAMATDVKKLSLGEDRVIVERGTLSERAVARLELPLPAIILFLTRFAEPSESALGGGGEVARLEPPQPTVKTIDVKEKEVGGVNLEEAEIIVGVGRGFKSKEDLKLAFELAELLGGQVGCTRPIAADLKWLSEDRWIGISGKRVSPRVYIAIGISGSPQHMSGVQGAKVIVAVNKDKAAPIFKQADYGVVADLYQFVPVLIKKLRERMGKA